VIGMRTCRINFDNISQLIIFDQLSENTMRGWRATDIAHANEENFYFGLIIQ
jgi:hypothetical protein